MGIDIKNNIGFVHIPKCGGTSICKGFNFTYNHDTYQKIISIHPNLNDIFTIVRNPYSRFLSAYNYIKMEKNFWHNCNNGSKHPLYDLANTKTSYEFVTMLYKGELDKYNSLHLKKQLDFLPKNLNNLKIFKLEEYEVDLYLKKLYGKNRPHINKSEGEISLNNDTKNIIYKCYEQDFLKLNYKK